MLYFTANKLTIKPYLKHLANELHLFGCYAQSYSNTTDKIVNLKERFTTETK